MQKENDSRRKGKILAIFMVVILISSSVGAVIDIKHILRSLTPTLKKAFAGWKPNLGTIKGGFKGLKETALHNKAEMVRTLGFVVFYYFMTKDITSDISENINKYILVNPDPLQSGLNRTLYSFISLLIPFYILALVSLGVYTLFLSTSPKGRSRAKVMISKLIIGMVLVSVSPHMLNLFFDFSTGVTKSILVNGQTEVTEAVDVYTGTMWGSWWLSVGAIYGINAPQMILKGAVEHKITKMSYVWKGLGSISKVLEKLHIEAEPGHTLPMLMLSVTLFIGVYGILAFRYLMTMLFTLLFPFTVFFLCFDPTRKLGGTLLEQLLLWTLVQEFYTLTLVAVGTGMLMIGGDSPLLAYGFGVGPINLISFFGIAACVTILMGPVILFMLLRNLLPPL